MSKKVIAIAVAIFICGALVPNLNAQTTLLTEGFESTFPPSGWAIAFGGGQNQWFRNDYTGCPNYTPGANGYCACNDDDYWGYDVQVINNTLTSPPFDASTWDEIDLQFEYVWQDYNGTEHAHVDVFNGSSWVEIEELGSTGTGSGMVWMNEVTSQVNYATNSRVRFRYNEDDIYAWAFWFLVDDVLVTGDTIGEIPQDSFDLEMVAINKPMPEEGGGEPFTPSCKVYCPLDGVTGANVSCKIKEVGGTGFVYQDDLGNVPFDRGYTDVDAFKDFTPEGGKKYNALFVVEHPDDINESNNFMDRNFTTSVGAQVDATQILAPAGDDQYGDFAPKANFQEMLSDAGVGAEGVMLRCKIEDAALHAVVYLDSVGPENFDPDEVYPATFLNIGAVLTDGTPYTITFWATLKNTPIGDDASKNFNFHEGIAETPIAELFGLDVAGTTVNFNVGKATEVSLSVYDVAGNRVATLASGTHSAGSYSVNWNTAGVGPGIYFVKMLTPEFSASGKIVVLY